LIAAKWGPPKKTSNVEHEYVQKTMVDEWNLLEEYGHDCYLDAVQDNCQMLLFSL
jgi:hypothetical protein